MSTAIEAATGVQQTQRALKCFLALQSKLPKDSNLWDQYNDISQRLFAEIGALQVSCPPSSILLSRCYQQTSTHHPASAGRPCCNEQSPGQLDAGPLQMGEQMGEKRARPETSPGNDTHKIEGATQKKRHRRNDGSPASA